MPSFINEPFDDMLSSDTDFIDSVRLLVDPAAFLDFLVESRLLTVPFGERY